MLPTECSEPEPLFVKKGECVQEVLRTYVYRYKEKDWKRKMEKVFMQFDVI